MKLLLPRLNRIITTVMPKKLRFSSLCLLCLLAACTSVTPAAPAPPQTSPTPTLTPAPSATPTPTLTPTPIPPLQVEVRMPETVSALPPVRVEADLLPPPDVRVAPIVTATVFQPGMIPYATFNLFFESANHYASTTFLQLPLDPPPGDWMVLLYVQSELGITGQRATTFRAVAPPTRVLSDALPSTVMLRVPQAFLETAAQGDAMAGNRAWRSCESRNDLCAGVGDVELWWAPGPAEPLTLDTAQMMLSITQDAENPPAIVATEETLWQDRAAFLFHEQWPGRRGGPAETWVIHGDDHWLYVLRIRAVGEDQIPDLVRQVAATFAFVTGE
ncbi:MAG: hypothetical protein JXA21_26375 [Anaerolineae bacterium]|nr:hypothetical protein [Anaerolineae bacterium]